MGNHRSALPRLIPIAIAGLAFLLARVSIAASPCYFLSIPCDRTVETVSGGAFPSFADTININPASIPVISTPVGVELIANSASGSNTSNATYNVALIKGFHDVGTAISTNSNNTFYQYNLVQAYQGTPLESQVNQLVSQLSTAAPNINLGGAVGLVLDKLKDISLPTFGLTLRYNNLTNNWDYGFGFSVNSKHFSLGVSSIYSPGNPTIQFPQATTTSLSAGAKFWNFNADFTELFYNATDPTLTGAPVFSSNVSIISLSAKLGSFLGAMAYRTSKNIEGDQVGVVMVSLAFQFSRSFAASYLYNYVPESQSLGAQIFLF